MEVLNSDKLINNKQHFMKHNTLHIDEDLKFIYIDFVQIKICDTIKTI